MLALLLLVLGERGGATAVATAGPFEGGWNNQPCGGGGYTAAAVGGVGAGSGVVFAWRDEVAATRGLNGQYA
jgi:hypothetical protein